MRGVEGSAMAPKVQSTTSSSTGVAEASLTNETNLPAKLHQASTPVFQSVPHREFGPSLV